MSSRLTPGALVLLGLVVAAAAAAGIGVRATHGAQTTADEPQYLLSALSLWEDGDLDISDELEAERYREFHEVDLPEQTLLLENGRRISPHDPGLPLLLAIPAGLGGWMSAKTTLAVMGGVLAALTAWTAHNRLGVSPRTALLVAGVFALAPPLAVYSTQVYPEIPAALALMIGVSALLGPFGRHGRIVLAAAVIVLPWLAVKYVPVAAVLATLGLMKAGKGRRLGLATGFLTAGAIYVVGHLLIYGGLTAYAVGDHFVGGELTVVGTQVDVWGRSARLIGLLVDRGFGIGAWQPAYLLLPLVMGWALAHKREEMRPLAALVGTGWLVATFVALTMHGWWFPGRQLVVVLPVAVLIVAAWADEAASRLRTVLAAGVLGVVAFGFLVAEGLAERLTWVVDFGVTTDPFYRIFAAVLPDYMEPSAATWALHTIWILVCAALAWVGWRSGRSSRAEPAVQSEEIERFVNKERVST